MKLLGRTCVAEPNRVLYCLAMLHIAMLLGCASPGPPHAPSLNLPQPPKDLLAHRVADTVELRFTAPARTTDNLPLKPSPMHIRLCRQLEKTTCVPVLRATQDVFPSKPGAPVIATLTDTLPQDLTQGPSRVLQYRVELLNPVGQGAGWSEPATTAAGAAPPIVEDFRAEGSRLGVLLQWKPAEGDVVLDREDLAANATPSKRKAGTPANLVRLAANGPTRTLDATAKPEIAYLYKAVRVRSVMFGGRSVELRSASSAAVPFTLHLVYPPPTPTALTAVSFASDRATFAVDLIWQPVDDTGLLAPLAGYNVYRASTSDPNQPREKQARHRLNAAPVPVPAFHDATAVSTGHYVYSVTAVDTQGNESPPTSTTLDQP